MEEINGGMQQLAEDEKLKECEKGSEEIHDKLSENMCVHLDVECKAHRSLHLRFEEKRETEKENREGERIEGSKKRSRREREKQ